MRMLSWDSSLLPALVKMFYFWNGIWLTVVGHSNQIHSTRVMTLVRLRPWMGLKPCTYSLFPRLCNRMTTAWVFIVICLFPPHCRGPQSSCPLTLHQRGACSEREPVLWSSRPSASFSPYCNSHCVRVWGNWSSPPLLELCSHDYSSCPSMSWGADPGYLCLPNYICSGTIISG